MSYSGITTHVAFFVVVVEIGNKLKIKHISKMMPARPQKHGDMGVNTTNSMIGSMLITAYKVLVVL